VATILLVDDDADGREAITMLLRSNGYLVEEAPNAAAALRYLLSGGVASAIILDQRMPGMTGRELLEQLKETSFADIPVIVYSGVRDDGGLPGIVAYVYKGTDPDLLLREIERVCDPAKA
jgi:two-component system, OmpR family, KDP operon response regulator KdpE